MKTTKAVLARKNDAPHAQLALGEALEQLNEVGSLRQCTLLRDLAIAFSLEGNVEAACNVAEDALTIAQRAKSAMYVQRLHDFKQQHLTRWKNHQLVKTFDGRLQVAQRMFKTA